MCGRKRNAAAISPRGGKRRECCGACAFFAHLSDSFSSSSVLVVDGRQTGRHQRAAARDSRAGVRRAVLDVIP